MAAGEASSLARLFGDRKGAHRLRSLVLDALEALTSRFTYRQLERTLGVDKSKLARYAAGGRLPEFDSAVALWSVIVRSEVVGRIVAEEVGRSGGFLDLSGLFSDTPTLKLVVLDLLARIAGWGVGVDRVLVPEAAGIPLATGVAWALNVPLVVARRSKDNPVVEYLEAHVAESPRVYMVYYAPKHSLRPRESVLVVDDVVQTGYTLAAMRRLAEAAGASLAGVAAVVTVGEEWRARSGIERVASILHVTRPPTH